MAQVVGALLLFVSLNSVSAADAGTWMVTDKVKNITCLMVQMDVKLNFTYHTNENKTKDASYRIPYGQTAVDPTGSNCGDDDTLRVSWTEGNSFDMVFKANGSRYDLSSFVVKLNTSSLFNDSLANQTTSITYRNDMFEIPANFSYHCTSEQSLNATDGSVLTISKVQFEAFKKDNSQKFSAAKDCQSTITPDIVPIAVGISLIALIVVVLIAYIVGRRRQQARGYLNIM